jgi:hypothetical protein
MFDAHFYPESSLTALELYRTDSRTTAAAEGSAIDLSAIDGNIMLILSAEAGTGTNPTLDITIEERVDATDTWAAIDNDAWFNPATNTSGSAADFTQVTNAANSFQKRGLKRQLLKAQIRATCTIGGTSTPTFLFSLIGVAQSRYTDGR